jgi:hypothetical protein
MIEEESRKKPPTLLKAVGNVEQFPDWDEWDDEEDEDDRAIWDSKTAICV